MKFKFFKYQACGNDFIIRDELDCEPFPEEKRGALAKRLCQRNFGIGADGLIFIVPSKKADAKMRLFDRDGPEADMCGNGIRCVGAYLHRKWGKDKLFVETKDDIKEIFKMGEDYKVNMGPLRYKMRELREYFNYDFAPDEPLLDKVISFPGLGEVKVSVVNTGEPHAVIFTEDIEGVEMERYGRSITKNESIFPKFINVDLVQVPGKDIKVRTYERGVFYETLACGTGATAAAGVAKLTGRINQDRIKVTTKGGEMVIEIRDLHMNMIGPAVFVYQGELEIGSIN
jgi:diaminopimelate epimerase